MRRNDRKVELNMIKKIEEIIRYFSVKIEGYVSSLETDELYVQVRNDKRMSGERRDEFHSETQKLLHMTKRARPGIDTAVAYLCTRVSKST